MKRYIVDVSALSTEEKSSAYERLEGYAFMVSTVFGADRRASAYEVFWDSQEDFMTSPIFPLGCPCREL